jgi:hypothetical protein
MSMEDYINVIWQVVRRYVLQAKLQSAPHKIDNHWPFEVAVAISSHNRDSRPKRAKLIENVLGANIAKMPDFISVPGDFSNRFGQTIVRVRQNENTQGVLQLLRRSHNAASYLINCYAHRVRAPSFDARVDLRDGGCYVASPALP